MLLFSIAWLEFDGLRAKECVEMAGLSQENPVYKARYKDICEKMKELHLFRRICQRKCIKMRNTVVIIAWTVEKVKRMPTLDCQDLYLCLIYNKVFPCLCQFLSLCDTRSGLHLVSLLDFLYCPE